ncbi:MAG: hypothetical protein RLY58_1003, partial [Pseudomonadota bacterium]
LTSYPDAISWLPLKGINQDMVVFLDEHQKILGVVDLRPWH